MRTEEISIRDPFVLPYDNKYYLYGTRAKDCWGPADGFDVYIGTDLENWDGPVEIFHNDGDFWADRNYWAPEVHLYNHRFYLFATFKSPERCRGTQILVSDHPAGPFRPHSAGPVTPSAWECLDGTFYVGRDGTPYMIFCHEWVQIHDGEVCAVRLSPDLKSAIGVPRTLFRASDAPWVRSVRGEWNFVTDGPCLHRTQNDGLVMFWSGFCEDGYAIGIARSGNGEINGIWTQDPVPLFSGDGGHGMLFRSFDGTFYLTFHTPNQTLLERPCFLSMTGLDPEGNLI